MKLLSLLFTLLIGSMAYARPISISGRVLDTGNMAVESPYVTFKIIITNNLNCVLYEETHPIDMSGSNGYFKLVAGSGTVTFGTNGFNVFTANKPYVCRDGSPWAAGASDIRKLAVSVKIDSNPWVDFSSDVINSVAYASESEYLQGRNSADFVQTNANVTQNKMESLSTSAPILLDLANGITSIYATQAALTAGLDTKEPKRPPGTNYLVQSNNLAELAGNPTSARTNLGLGVMATKNSVDSADINAVAWTKIANPPASFPPSAHVHAITDITNLGTILNDKADKSAYICSTNQVLVFNVLTGFTCADIQMGGDISNTAGSSLISKLQGKNVVISNPQDQDVLSFNNLAQRWENKPNNLATASINTTGDITAGNITATKQISGSTNSTVTANSATLDFSSSNTIIASHNCVANIALVGLKDGGVYTFVNLDTSGTTKCTFTADLSQGDNGGGPAPTAVIKYSPANTNRIGGGAVTVYSILRASNYILVAWTSGFQ